MVAPGSDEVGRRRPIGLRPGGGGIPAEDGFGRRDRHAGFSFPNFPYDLRQRP